MNISLQDRCGCWSCCLHYTELLTTQPVNSTVF